MSQIEPALSDTPTPTAALGPNPLDALHRELIETRNLAIKTDNLIKNLSAEIKQMARKQDSYQRRTLINSGVAYLLFVATTFIGLYLAFDAKLSSARQEVSHYASRNQSLSERLEEVEHDLSLRRDAENRVYEFFQLLESGSPDDVVEQFNQLQSQITDRAMLELLRDRVDEINYNLADQAYRDGLGFLQAENWTDARDSFLKSVQHLERTPWQFTLYFNLGTALEHLEDYEGALSFYDQALASPELDDVTRASASYSRGVCLEATGRATEALQAYQEYRDHYPDHRFVGRALHRINAIQREIDRASQSDESQ